MFLVLYYVNIPMISLQKLSIFFIELSMPHIETHIDDKNIQWLRSVTQPTFDFSIA